MGAWGMGSFENDDALDFFGDIKSDDDLALIGEVFKKVLDSKAYLEAPDASCAIVGAEIICAAMGQPTEAAKNDNELQAWLEYLNPSFKAEDINQAIKVIERILGENSELLDLWEETDDMDEWGAGVNEIIQNLGKLVTPAVELTTGNAKVKPK